MVEDCIGTHEAKGYCAKHYTRLRKNGTLEKANFVLGQIPNGCRVVPMYETYCVSTDGKVFSRNYRNKGITQELSQTTHPEGYKRVKVSGRKNAFQVHRMVALAFIENPNKYPQVNHINGEKGDNRVENLEWCTNSQNQKHAFDNKLHIYANGENHVNAKLSEKEVFEILKELSEVKKYHGQLTDLAKKYGVTKHCILNIKTKKSWSHLNDKS